MVSFHTGKKSTFQAFTVSGLAILFLCRLQFDLAVRLHKWSMQSREHWLQNSVISYWAAILWSCWVIWYNCLHDVCSGIRNGKRCWQLYYSILRALGLSSHFFFTPFCLQKILRYSGKLTVDFKKDGAFMSSTDLFLNQEIGVNVKSTFPSCLNHCELGK